MTCNCGHEFEPGVTNGVCPKCGTIVLEILDEAIKLGDDHVSELHTTEGGNVLGFSESERDGRTTSAELVGGAITSHLTGTPPQGEEDTPYVCAMLVETFNRAGGNWLPPDVGQGVADGIAADANDHRKLLRIQVVRADKHVWLTLRKSGHVTATPPVNDIVETIKEAISHKVARLPIVSRRGVTLALDANRLPAYAFTDVVSSFQRDHGKWATSLAFDSIWIVGPHPELVKSLTTKT